MNMYGVVCVLCAVKFEESASRINVRGRCVFPVETEMMKLPVVICQIVKFVLRVFGN